MIGIIGGTGLYKMEGLQILETRDVETPFGKPSAPIVIGELSGARVAFLPRHGTRHQFLPTEINYRANIWALKSAGVRRIAAVSAVGSLVQEIAPGDLALVSQYFDWTRGKRASTFFGSGVAAHVSTAEPACPALARSIRSAAQELSQKLHIDRTYACVEGPRLGSRAESFFLKSAGCELVGMTNVPEAFLAREAQLCYCTIAIATDYDCWLDDPSKHVSAEKVLALYQQKLGAVRDLIWTWIEDFSSESAPEACSCRTSLAQAVLTPEGALNEEQRKLLAFLKA